MSNNGKGVLAYKKKDLPDQKIGSTYYQDIEFAHKSVGGETEIKFDSLITPPEYTAQDGFSNPSTATLIGANILMNKANITLVTTGPRERLQHRQDYIIRENNQIRLLFTTEEDEIISGVIHNIVRNRPGLVDAENLAIARPMTIGETNIVTGKAFKVNANSSSRIGEIQVMRWLDGGEVKLLLRNVNNSPLGAGDYYEVDSGNGYGNTVVLTDPAIATENISIQAYGRLVERNQQSYMQELETLGSQLDALAEFVADQHAVPLSTFQVAPNQIDLGSFSKAVLAMKPIIVGANGEYTSLQAAIDDAPAGARILVQNSYNTVENITVDKKLFIYGEGNNSNINGTLDFAVGSEKSIAKFVRFTDDVTVANTVKGLIVTDCWIAATKTVTDNNPSDSDSLYLLVEEV